MANKTSEKSNDLGHQLQKTPIAIIGMASIFAQAKNLTEYWDNILNKIDAVTEVPDSRWSIADYYDPDPSKPDKSYCKRGGFLPDIDFDPVEFGLPPNILEVTDVSQLLGLVVARDALEDAGYGEDHPINRENTGVILGVVGVSSKIYVPLTARLQYPVWERVLKNCGLSESDTQRVIEKFKLAYVGWEENSFPGSLTNVVSGRIANRFDLGGTNCVLDAACATSMAAIKMSVMELIEGRADMMLSGGVDTDNSIGVYMSFSKTPAFSKGQSVRSFDADSDGMMAGEGIGMVVLKRLADAERDGDRIYAVLRGFGSSSDGRFKSIYAPRPGGQAIALRRTYEEAGYSPATLGLVEAHGTGTPAGDPAEFQGLRDTMNEFTSKRQYIAIGSVKSQIAHTKGAAGVAGLMKVALALHHKILPATINVKKPNPKLNITNSAFYINTETRPWFRHDHLTPRRAGVSSFGFGGTNFHITVEEHTAEHTTAYRTHSVPQTVLITALSTPDLLIAAKETLSKLHDDPHGLFYNELCASSEAIQIPMSDARLGFTATSRQEAEDLLKTACDFLQQRPNDEAWDHPKGIYFRRSGMDTKGKIVALFSGQGSQYLEMGRELACNFPPIRQALADFDQLFVEDGMEPLSRRVFPSPVFSQEERDVLLEQLTQTEFAQPAIGAFSAGLYKLLKQAGFTPDFVAGHSFGELTALWASGVLNEKDYYSLAKARGKAMSPPSEPSFDAGSMLAVKGDALQVREEIKEYPEIILANWNSINQIVLAGAKIAVTKVQQVLAEKGYSAVTLPVSAAFHTPLVGHAHEPFVKAIHEAKFSRPKIRVFSNTTGKAYPLMPQEIRKVLEGHILNPVLFKDEIENIYTEGGSFFIEFGPKNILTNLVKNILGDRPHLAVALNASPKKDSDRQLRDAIVQLRVAGLALSTLDPYKAIRKQLPLRKNSPVTVKLNGSNYVSPKTRAAFENALKDGFTITPRVEIKEVVKEVVKEVMIEKLVPSTLPAQATFTPRPTPTATNMSTIENSLTQFQQHQSEVTRLHEQYLKNEETFANIFAKLSELEIALVSNASQSDLSQIVPVFEGLERSMARFHEHQAETLRIHAAYLKSQEDFANQFVRLAEQQRGGQPAVRETNPPVSPLPLPDKKASPTPAPLPVRSQPTQPVISIKVEEKPLPSPVGNGHNGAAKPPAPLETPRPAQTTILDSKVLTQALLNVVSEKTGYPAEMLALDTDMEADLGIDSIKRVEILGAMRTLFPSLPKADPEAFAEVHTLGQTVDYMLASSADTGNQAPQALPAALVPAETGAPTSPETVLFNRADLTSALLNVVSEKTGYPAEMLALDTDMEADLGIDSIKRVEILGAMRTLFPSLPKADPEAFAEVHTLGQTVDYMLASSGESENLSAANPLTPEALLESALVSSTEPAVVTSNLDSEALTAALLRIVSDKTGYPVEMLALDTDMEADLGIDSIKRVEILGALRTEFPVLPQADPEAFAEVHTLGQIVEYLTAGEKKSKNPESVSVTIPLVADSTIPRGVVNLKLLPQPDERVLNLPTGAICLLTDNGTRETGAVAQDLLGRGWKVVVLSFPGAIVAPRLKLPEGVERVSLADMSEDQLQHQLETIAQQYGPVAAMVHLNPPYADTGNELYSESEKQLIRHIFLLAKHLKEPLTQAARKAGAAFIVVAHLDGQFGLGESASFSPISGGLFGLVKTLNLEWEHVFCRAVDISPEIPLEQAHNLICAEIFDPNCRLVEVGHSKAGRATLAIETPNPAQVLE